MIETALALRVGLTIGFLLGATFILATLSVTIVILAMLIAGYRWEG